MPYITQEDRKLYDDQIDYLAEILKEEGWVEGHLNYVISRLIGRMFEDEPRYHTIARIDGVLNGVAREFYRRIAGPYEDNAALHNGDIDEYERFGPARAIGDAEAGTQGEYEDEKIKT